MPRTLGAFYKDALRDGLSAPRAPYVPLISRRVGLAPRRYLLCQCVGHRPPPPSWPRYRLVFFSTIYRRDAFDAAYLVSWALMRAATG